VGQKKITKSRWGQEREKKEYEGKEKPGKARRKKRTRPPTSQVSPTGVDDSELGKREQKTKIWRCFGGVGDVGATGGQTSAE